MNLQVAELLEKAADALESGRVRWGQYKSFSMSKPPGTFCAIETIEIVGMELAPMQRWPHPRHLPSAAAADMVSLHVTKGRDRQHLAAWNDAPIRTMDEVIEAFKETAKELRNQTPPAPLAVL